MGKKLARFQIVINLSFIHSYSIDYLKDINLLNLLRALVLYLTTSSLLHEASPITKNANTGNRFFL